MISFAKVCRFSRVVIFPNVGIYFSETSKSIFLPIGRFKKQ